MAMANYAAAKLRAKRIDRAVKRAGKPRKPTVAQQARALLRRYKETKMKARTYRVMWEIDIDADSAVHAAIEALRIQRSPDSIATSFTVIAPNGSRKEIDLGEGEIVEV